MDTLLHNQDLTLEIKSLAKQRDALILSHYYEDGAIQELADFVGDSLALAQKGELAKNPVILLAGVVFMGESVKLLSPQKTVLVPDLKAGCSLVDQSPYGDYLSWRRQFPEAICVTYVNSSLAVKSISDVIVTSSNAEKVIRAIPEDRKILFGPDRNLGSWLAKKTGRSMELWRGACEVHILFSAQKMAQLKKLHPKALVIAHPECDEGVLQYSDIIGSTSRLLQEVQTNTGVKEFIVATEIGIFHQMQKLRPEAKLIQAPAQGNCACAECPYMKLNTLEKIRNTLRDLSPEIKIESTIADKARISLQRMMAITRDEIVAWPDRFTE